MVGLAKEINTISKLLSRIGFILEEEQPHVNGERFLASPDKLVLVGKRKKDNLRVIIKASALKRAKEEIKQEKKVRDIISSFPPFKKAIFIPNEIYFGKLGKYEIFVTEYIDQEKVFIAHSIREQLGLIRETYELREPLNGHTFKIVRKMYSKFPSLGVNDYLTNFKKFERNILERYRTPGIEEAMREAFKFIKHEKDLIEAGCEHLVHSDFAPHNFRVNGSKLYTLDCSAFIFGNKHEEMARLLNYMTIHNPKLERKVKDYLLKEKGEQEYLSLRVLRAYKIQFLLNFYTQALSKTTKDLLALTTHRVEFWEEVLRCVLKDQELDPKILSVYLENRDNLRSEEEKVRQREFAKA